MPFDHFVCPECGSTRLKVSAAAPPCYYCALCAYVVRNERGEPVTTEEALRSWVLGVQGLTADLEPALQHGTADLSATAARRSRAAIA
jgi:rubredoxin